MPLTLQLYGSEPDNHGHFIIDRRNMIFVYKAVSTETDHIQSVLNKKIRLQEAVYANHTYDQYLLGDDETFMDTINDPRHDAFEHSSLYDKQSFHYHLIFQEDVVFEHVKLVFENLSLDNIEDLISEECRQEILTIAAEYFHDLTHSPSAQSIEAEYRIMKSDEIRKAHDEMTNHGEKIVTSPINLLMQKFGFMAKNPREQQFDSTLLELDEANQSVETQQIPDESASQVLETSIEHATEMLESTNLSNENSPTQVSSNQLRRSSSPVMFFDQVPPSNANNLDNSKTPSTQDLRNNYPSFS